MPPEQNDVYFLFAPSRELALQSPYMEGFAEGNREVLFVYSAINDLVMANLTAFEGRDLVSADRSEVDLPKKDADKKKDDKEEAKSNEDKATPPRTSLSKSEAADFCAWFQSVLGTKVSTCRITDHLTSSPAVVTDAESGALRWQGWVMHALKDADPTLVKVVAEQVYDNCLVATGLLDDGRSMLPRLNDLMLCVVKAGVRPGEEEEGGSDDAKAAGEQAANEPNVVVPQVLGTGSSGLQPVPNMVTMQDPILDIQLAASIHQPGL
ncbi:hypothetical protein ACHAWF_004861 [Thalassiosira exigua]